MAYHYSDIDRKNIRWMSADNTCATLSAIRLVAGTLRGLGRFKIDFCYPITAIAGENGSGKSTLLAMAACAFHNGKNGFKLSERKTPYYTFSDFFVQTQNEVPPQGIHIKYQIRHDEWHRSDPGPGWQSRKKREGGRWSDYEARVDRNVIYFGIHRVVPHYERSAHKSYRSRFQLGQLNAELCDKIRNIAGRIIGKTYERFEVHTHSKYSLPFTSVNGVPYSGFNMGAGESAIFEILTTLFNSKKGALLVIDEIELGLHEKAQRRFIKELKKLCSELHCQIICSTHSHVILDELPPEGRFFIEGKGDTTKIISGVSADWACGKLAGRNTDELDIFVEDGAACSILQIGLPHEIRSRINIHPIGSSEAVLRQLTSRYLEGRNNCLAILDGDKRDEYEGAKQKIAKYSEASTEAEKTRIKNWAGTKISYLPGDTWPERWLIQSAQVEGNKSDLVEQWGMTGDEAVISALESSLQAGKHNEFYRLNEEIQQSIEQVRADIIRFVFRNQRTVLDALTDKFDEALVANT